MLFLFFFQNSFCSDQRIVQNELRHIPPVEFGGLADQFVLLWCQAKQERFFSCGDQASSARALLFWLGGFRFCGHCHPSVVPAGEAGGCVWLGLDGNRRVSVLRQRGAIRKYKRCHAVAKFRFDNRFFYPATSIAIKNQDDFADVDFVWCDLFRCRRHFTAPVCVFRVLMFIV